MKASDIITSGLYLIRLLFSLFTMWLTFGWRVRKTRKAFEKQLIHQGMAKKDAKKLSAQYSKMKNEIMNSLKGSLFRNI
jgi:hypothetical protein